MAGLLLALIGCEPREAVNHPRPTPESALATPFEPTLPFADKPPATFHAAGGPDLDREHLLSEVGDGRYWGTVGADGLPLYDFKSGMASTGLVAPNFASRAHQHFSSVASFWDFDGGLRGHLDGLRYISDLTAARDAPLVAFATETYIEDPQPSNGLWLFNTRASRFYARNFCEGGVGEAVALSRSGHVLAGRCAGFDREKPKPWPRVNKRVSVWDLRRGEGNPLCTLSVEGAPEQPLTGIAGSGSAVALSDDGAVVAFVTGGLVRVVRVQGCEVLAEAPLGALIHVDEESAVLRQGERDGALIRYRFADRRLESIAGHADVARFAEGRLYWSDGLKVEGLTVAGDRLGPVDLKHTTMLDERGEVSDLQVLPGGSVLARVWSGSLVQVSGDLRSIERGTIVPSVGRMPETGPDLLWSRPNELTVGVAWASRQLRWHLETGAVDTVPVPAASDATPKAAWDFICNELPKRYEDPNCVDVGRYIVSPCVTVMPDKGLSLGAAIQTTDEDGRAVGDPQPPKAFHVRYNQKPTVSTWVLEGAFHGCAIAPDVSMVVVAQGDAGVVAYRAETGERLWTVKERVDTILSLSADGLVGSAGEGRIVWIDLETRAAVRTWQAHRTDCGLAAAISPDGKRLATTSCDGTLRVWGRGTPAIAR